MRTIERRYFAAAEIRLVEAEGKRTLTGYGAVFDSLSLDLGGFVEKIAHGAFDATLGADPDVRCLVDHNPTLILGRTVSGTLRLAVDEIGLKFECDLPDTQAARDLAESIARGDVSQCSFGFLTVSDTWESGPDGAKIRTLVDVSLQNGDVSVVTYPAYPDTSIALRSLDDHHRRSQGLPPAAPAGPAGEATPPPPAEAPPIDQDGRTAPPSLSLALAALRLAEAL